MYLAYDQKLGKNALVHTQLIEVQFCICFYFIV